MKLSMVTIFLTGAGVLLVWSGITDRNPVHVMRALLTGDDMPARGSWGGSSSGGTAETVTETVPPGTVPPGSVTV